MDLTFDYFFKIVDGLLLVMVVVMSYATKTFVPQRYRPALPLFWGLVAGWIATPYTDGARALVKAAIFYGGGASLAFKFGWTTIMGRGISLENDTPPTGTPKP